MAGPGLFNRSEIVRFEAPAAAEEDGYCPNGFYEQLRAKEHLVRDQLREQLQAFLPPEERDQGPRQTSSTSDPHIPSLEDFLASLDLEDDPLDPEVLEDTGAAQELSSGTSSGSRAAPRGGDRESRAEASWFSHVGGRGGVAAGGQLGGGSASRLRRGQAVTVQGLQRRHELNGLTGELGRFDGERGRWQVFLDAREPLWMRPDNLEARVPVLDAAPGPTAGLSRGSLYGNWLVRAETDFVATVCEGGRTLYDGLYMGSEHDIDVYGSGRSIIIERSGGWKVDTSSSGPDVLVWTRAGDKDVLWRRTQETPTEFLVDNGRLRATGPGLAYRRSKQMDDRADDSEYAPWETTVQGVDRGGGWVQVGLRFLPRRVEEVPVLLSQEERRQREQRTPRPRTWRPAGWDAAEPGAAAHSSSHAEAAAEKGDEAAAVPGYAELMAMLGEEGPTGAEAEAAGDASEVEEVAPVYDRDDPTVVSLLTLRVTSAGDPACNGIFRYEAPHKGRPLYKADSGAIVYFNQSWKMNSCYKTTGWLYSVEGSDSQLPPAGPWTARDPAEPRGTAPELKICGQVLRIASEKGPLLKLEDGRVIARKDEQKGWCRGAPFQ